MNLSTKGLVFYAAFVVLSVFRRMIEGAEFSAGYIQSTLAVGAIAAALYVVLLRLAGEQH